MDVLQSFIHLSMDSLAVKKPRRQHKHYSMAKYAEAVEAVRNRKSCLREISKELNIPVSTVTDWTRKDPRQNFATRIAKHPELELELCAYIDDHRTHGIILKDLHIRQEAKRIGKRDRIPNFLASEGWLRRFKKRNRYSNRKPTHTARKTEFSMGDKVG